MIISLFQALVVMSLVAASNGGCEKKNNDSGGTHKVNGEFSGPGYTYNLSHLFFLLYFPLRFSLPIFHHSRLQPLAKAFFSGTTGAGLMGINHQYHHFKKKKKHFLLIQAC